MPLVDDIKKGGLGTLALGKDILALVPAVLPVMAQVARPFFEGAVKSGLVCLEKGQEAVAEIRGILDEAVTEARAEVHAGKKNLPAAAPEPPVEANAGEPDPEVMG